MEEKICQIHEGEVLSACFFEGCTQHFLCGECFGFHPESHKCKIKSIMSLMRKDDWIKLNEEQRDSQIVHMKHYSQTKDCLLDENQKKLQGLIEEMIDCLTKRLSQWVEELKILLDLNKNQKTKEMFAKLEDSLSSLENIDFREDDIYGKVDKAKLFNENILPESKEVCKQAQTFVDGVKVDQSKLDYCKNDMIELLESIHLKDLFALSKSKRQNASQQLIILQKEYENFKQEKDTQIEKLKQVLEHLEKSNNEGHAQLNLVKEELSQLILVNNDYKKQIESLTISNEELKNEASMFEAELNSVVSAKLKLHKDLEALSTDHKNLFENYLMAKCLSENSRIIQNKDLHNITTWIPKPTFPHSSFSLKLYLIYRGTRDGFICLNCQMKCEKRSPTITFIKSKEHGRVFGGYTTAIKKWKNNDNYIEDKDAFLFSLTHGEKYPIKHPRYAIQERSNHLVAFGQSDICILEHWNGLPNLASSCFPTSYECPKFSGPDAPGAKEYLAGSSKFTVEEIEVYQVVWLG